MLTLGGVPVTGAEGRGAVCGNWMGANEADIWECKGAGVPGGGTVGVACWRLVTNARSSCTHSSRSVGVLHSRSRVRVGVTSEKKQLLREPTSSVDNDHEGKTYGRRCGEQQMW